MQKCIGCDDTAFLVAAPGLSIKRCQVVGRLSILVSICLIWACICWENQRPSRLRLQPTMKSVKVGVVWIKSRASPAWETHLKLKTLRPRLSDYPTAQP